MLFNALILFLVGVLSPFSPTGRLVTFDCKSAREHAHRQENIRTETLKFARVLDTCRIEMLDKTGAKREFFMGLPVRRAFDVLVGRPMEVVTQIDLTYDLECRAVLRLHAMPDPEGVILAPAAVRLAPDYTGLKIDESRRLTATVYAFDKTIIKDAKVVWHTTNPNIAVVDATGVVRGVAPGNASIYVVTKERSIKSSSVRVRVSKRPLIKRLLKKVF